MTFASSRAFYLYLLFLVSLFFTDVLTSVTFPFFGAQKTLSFLSDATFFAILYFVFRNKVKFNYAIDRTSLFIFTLVTLIISFWKLPIPDTATDTLNYHLFQQNYFFDSNIDFNFLPAASGTFVWPMSDRAYSFFNFMLGYRAGTILGGIVCVISLLQIQILLNLLLDEWKLFLRKLFVILLCLIFVFSEYVTAQISLYLVDLLMVPIFLEVLLSLVVNAKENKSYIYLGGLLSLAFTLKLTNAVYFVPYLVWFSVIFYRHLKLNFRFFGHLLMVALPPIFYMIWTWWLSGNPIFPLLNGVFKSPYFPTYFLKTAGTDYLGPAGFWECLIFPLTMILEPVKTVNLNAYSGRITLASLATLIFFACIGFDKVWRKRNQTSITILFYYFIGLVAWIVGSGYLRYAFYLEVLSSVVIATLCFYLYSKRLFLKSISLLMLTAYIVSVAYSVYLQTNRNLDWAWRPSVFENPKNYKDNLKMVFTDRKTDIPSQYFNDIQGWLVYFYNSGYMFAIKDRVPVINMNFFSRQIPGWDDLPALKEKQRQHLDSLRDKSLYTLARPDQLSELIEKVEKQGIGIKSVHQIKLHMLSPKDSALLVKLAQEVNSFPRLSRNLVQDSFFEASYGGPWIFDEKNNQRILGRGEKEKNFVRTSVQNPVSQIIEVKGDQLYRLSMLSRICEGTGLARLQINWMNRDRLLDVSIKVFSPSETWAEKSELFFSPEGATHGVVYVGGHESTPICFTGVHLNEVL